MKFLKFLGALLYAFVSSYLIWLLFYFLVPWLMSFGWIALIIYWILAGGLIAATLKFVSSMITVPLFVLVGGSRISGFIAALIYAFVGIVTVLLPWNLDIPYRLVTIIIGVSLSLTALSIFSMTIAVILTQSRRYKTYM